MIVMKLNKKGKHKIVIDEIDIMISIVNGQIAVSIDAPKNIAIKRHVVNANDEMYIKLERFIMEDLKNEK